MEKRKSGFYWVKNKNFWQAAEFFSRKNIWYLCGVIQEHTDDDIDEINENRIYVT